MRQTTQTLASRAKVVLDSFVSAMAGEGTFAEREVEAMRLANELVRQYMQRELEMLEAQHGSEVLVDGVRFRRHSTGRVRYHSLCGSIQMTRGCYRKVGVHNGPTVIPLELAAGIIQNGTPALVKSVMLGFATMPLRHYEAEMSQAARVVPSRTVLERIGKRTSQALLARHATIEPALRESEAVHPEAVAFSVGLDRTTIPMAELDTNPRREVAPKIHQRTPPPPIVVNYRMAYVATIAQHDREGKALATRRVTATAEEGSDCLRQRLLPELADLRSKAPNLPFIVIQDGAPELWNLVDAWLAMLDIEPAWRLIDRFHLDERLARSCDALSRISSARRSLYRRWQNKLDRSEEAAEAICRAHERLVFYPRRTLSRERAKTIEQNWGYLQHNKKRMNYVGARRAGFPIGSGVTEGACKSVITSRFKRSGQRWSSAGSASCLYARTLHLNMRLMPALDLFERQQLMRMH